MKNNFFHKNLCPGWKKNKDFVQKTDPRFIFPDPDYLWSNFIKNNFFRKKPFLCLKKLIPKKF